MKINQLLVLGLLFFVSLCQATTHQLITTKTSPQFNRHVQSLNELTERRRTNRLFINPQANTTGYTNLVKGSATFAMRDLVLIHRLSIAFTRVYDSSFTAASDFGIGWHLAYNEQITQQINGDLIYFDDTGSRRLLTDFESIDDQIKLQVADGFTKTFTPIDNHYKLTQITNPNGQTVYITYQNNQIQRIYNDHQQSITITRNQQGYIDTITDNHGRSLKYTYKDNLLINNQDLAGNLWHYHYHNNRLVQIKDPEGNLAANFTDIVKSKTQHAQIHTEQTTKVAVNDKPAQSDIKHYYNDKGLLSKIQQDKDIAKFEYTDLGQLEKITFPNGNFHNYHYNKLGFRTKTIRSDGSMIDYSYDDTGNLLTLTETNNKGESQFKQMKLNNNLTTEYIVDGKVMLDITYDSDGNPTHIKYNGKPITYEYDKSNRLTKIIDGEQTLNYTYQANEPDIRIQQDKRSFNTYLNQKQISHNALNINRLYTRSVKANVKNRKISDIQQDANQRRRLYNALAKDKKGQRDFDKPSNSFFIPLTYRAINCEADFCWELIEVYLTGPSNITVGQTATFTATSLIGSMYDEFERCEVQYQFSVNGNVIEYNSSGIFNYTFHSAGTPHVQVRGNCQNCAAFNFQYTSFYPTVADQACEIEFKLNGSGDYQIDATPKMPDITATVTKLFPSDADVKWTAQLKHNRSGSCGGKTQYDSPIVEGEGNSFTPNWQNQLYGGDLIIEASCSAAGYEGKTVSNNSRKVKATEPSTTQKGNQLVLSTSPFDSADLRRIACHESNFRQFKSTGLPIYGSGGDAGLMQICFQQSSQHQWDWIENISQSQIILNDAKRGAKNWLDKLVRERQAPQYSNQTLREEAIHRYNAGCCGSSNAYRDFLNNQWVVVDKGGIGQYVSSVLAKGISCTN